MGYNTAAGRAEITAVAAQEDFDFVFKIYTDEDIVAWLTPNGEEPSDVDDLLVLDVDYTVEVNGDDGGVFTLLSAASAGDYVTLVRSLSPKRLVEYPENGDLRPSVLNSDQNYQTYLVADTLTALEKTMRLPVNAQDVSGELPQPIALAYLRWAADAKSLENDTTIPDAVQTTTDNAAAALQSAEDAAVVALAAAASADATELDKWIAHASVLTAESYATEAEDVEVNIVTSDGDGTFTYTPQTGVYSSLHWAAEAGAGTPTTFTPILSGNATGTALTDLVVTVDNWNSDQLLTISVDEGSYVDNDDGTITWTLGAVEQTDTMSVQSTEPSMLISAIATHDVDVTEAPEADQTILYENATISATQFPTTTDIDLSGNTILAEADDASATSAVVEQDGGDTDFINATPTVDNTTINYDIDAGATNTSATVTGQALTDGDTVLLNDGASTTLVEFDTTGNVTDNSDVTSSADPFDDGSLIAKYEMNDNLATTNVIDTSGVYNATASVNTNTLSTTGKFGTGLIFNGSSEYIATGIDHSALSAITISSWIKFTGSLDSIPTAGVDGSYTNEGTFAAFESTSRLDYVADGDYHRNSPFSVSAGWHQVAVSDDKAGNVVMYVDGVEVPNSIVATTAYTANTDIQIGRKRDGGGTISYYANHQDQTEIYDRVLTADEINSLYTQQVPKYTLDLTSASLTSAPTTIAKDTATISTSIVGTGAGDDFEARTIVSHTGNIATTPATITDVFDTDTRTGRDIKHKVELADDGDEVSRISTVVQKLG